jgi:GNAT superfamily N-acetyltransferase
MRSKAHWGYDDSFMAQCVASLTIANDEIEAGLVAVIVDAQDLPVGHAAIAMTDATTADVAAMFVEPAMIGHGLGRPLFEAGLEIARKQGATRLTILSDPQARGFYERMGACYVEDRPSDAIPGRILPWLVLEI